MYWFYTSLAVFFIGGSILEYLLNRKEHPEYYSLKDFRSSTLLMITGLLVDAIGKAIAVYFLTILARHSLFHIGYEWWAWVACYILWDFVFYIKHYMEHNVWFMWAIHVNHHSSPYMNLSTSLRSGVFKAAYRYFFWAILIVIGFRLEMFFILYGVGKLWAFFSHSQKLGRWGVLERFTITPTHHLLHHSSDKENLNKNFGETFSIWDKLFGTFKETSEPLRYGIEEQINHEDFKEVVFHEFGCMVKEVKNASGIRHKLAILFGKPYSEQQKQQI